MRTKFKIILALLCLLALVSIDNMSAEAQTYNDIYITGLNVQPNPVSSGAATIITINTFEDAQWFWLWPTTLARPIIIISVAGRAILADMTSEAFSGGGAWGWGYFIWFYEDGTWTHQAVWDGRDSQGNLVPAGPYLATVYVFAGGASAVVSIVINIEELRKIVLSLNPNEVFPEYSTTVTATVYDASNNPVPNYPVTLEALAPQYGLDSDEDCGFHSHDTNRPIGNFLSDQGAPIGSSAQGTTDTNGQFTINYQASQFGGVEAIRAWGIGEPDVKDEKGLTVRVSGLVELPSSGDYYIVVRGGTDTHPQGTYGSPNTIELLKEIAEEYFGLTDRKLSVNDLSLPWGGLFDLNNKWTTPHSLHRTGNDVDINRTDGGGVLTNCVDDRDLKDAVSAVSTGGIPNLVCEEQGTKKHINFH